MQDNSTRFIRTKTDKSKTYDTFVPILNYITYQGGQYKIEYSNTRYRRLWNVF